MDMVVKTSHIPAPGETVLGGAFLMNPGGKGANQAVAVARLGGEVSFISKVGQDIFGQQARQGFEAAGIDIRGLLTDPVTPSGVALITVDKAGENSIVVAPGANANLGPADVAPFLEQAPEAAILLMQLEIPLETVRFAARYAASRGIRVILNPAPAQASLADIFPLIDIITPNAKEAEMLTGIAVKDVPGARAAAASLHQQGVKQVVITLGEAGAVLLQDGAFHVVPAPKVEALDTTAAGDVFNGALAVALAEGKDLLAAVHFACHAAAVTVTRMGAQASIPFRHELMANALLTVS